MHLKAVFPKACQLLCQARVQRASSSPNVFEQLHCFSSHFIEASCCLCRRAAGAVGPCSSHRGWWSLDKVLKVRNRTRMWLSSWAVSLSSAPAEWLWFTATPCCGQVGPSPPSLPPWGLQSPFQPGLDHLQQRGTHNSLGSRPGPQSPLSGTFPHTPYLNLPSFYLMLFPFVLSQSSCAKTPRFSQVLTTLVTFVLDAIFGLILRRTFFRSSAASMWKHGKGGKNMLCSAQCSYHRLVGVERDIKGHLVPFKFTFLRLSFAIERL